MGFTCLTDHICPPSARAVGLTFIHHGALPLPATRFSEVVVIDDKAAASR